MYLANQSSFQNLNLNIVHIHSNHQIPLKYGVDFQFDVLRLYTDGHLFLKLLNPDGTDVIPGFTKDLINAIMSSPAYHTQEDLDREDTYLIELVLSKDGVIVSLRVNGWETVSTTPEV